MAYVIYYVDFASMFCATTVACSKTPHAHCWRQCSEMVFSAITSLFFFVGQKELHFWNQLIILHMTQLKP